MATPTLWIIESTYVKPTDEIARVTPAHREWLDQHYRSGVFLTSGRKVDNTGGVIVAQADTLQELVDLFDHDPFVQAGCSRYRYTAFNPVKRGRAVQIEGVPLVE
ncbi:YciI family protein [Deinococcus sp. RIT780]|uniref:YciI family protein n=1 Tax=Deinococcus sp. RIT780 TaxID=2870472 RepID=UPI001C8AB7ED|nr:YciI family protein [Deinococcus sp. RIT780]MBX8466356.1 YciI family protein [Deinococcus sp. RIT780]